MKSLLLTLTLLFSASFASANNDCSIKLQGIDGWPWAIAQPWKDIQGIWKLNTDKGDIYFKFRITVQMNKRKILLIDKIVDGNCAKPAASGVGYISIDERNSVRAVISDDKLRYQLKLALFDTQDLSSNLVDNIYSCGEKVIGISVLEVIGRAGKQIENPTKDDLDSPPENMMLKKVSDSLDSICKKPTGR